MNSYEHLFSPIQIGTTTVKNRVFMPPISTNLMSQMSWLSIMRHVQKVELV